MNYVQDLITRAQAELKASTGLRAVSKALVAGHTKHVAGGRLALVAAYQRKAPIIFASGSNHQGEIRGFHKAGGHVGVAAPELNEKALQELERLAGTGTKVFLDSGAFSEVEERPDGPPVVVKPITDAEWRKRLATYQRLAKRLKGQLYVVAPDLVGNQEATLERLARYAPEMRELQRQGVHILAPIQFGPVSPGAFYWKAAWALGFPPTPAFPLKKAALWTPEDVGQFVGLVKPHEIHLLGLGAKSKKGPAYLDAIHEANPATQVSQDSNLISAAVGRDKETGKATRALTAAQDLVRDEHLEGWNREVEDPEFGAVGDFTDEIAEPSAWMGKAARAALAKEVGLSAGEARTWMEDPDGFLQGLSPNEYDTWGTYQPMAYAMENAWIAERDRRLTASRKMEAITRAFEGHPIAGQVKAKAKPAKLRRWEVAPGAYEEGPEGRKAIFQTVQAYTDGRTKLTGRLAPHPNFEQAVRFHGRDPKEVLDLFDRYNRGERWIA